MIRHAVSFATLALVLLATGCAMDKADVALRSGKVFTMDPANPWAESVIIKDGHIIHVGDDYVFDQLVGPRTNVIDLRGRLVLPELCEEHAELLRAALAEEGVDLDVALPGFTPHGDFGSRAQDECGPLREGGYADVMVLDRDLFEEAQGAQIDLAIFAGEIVYERK